MYYLLTGVSNTVIMRFQHYLNSYINNTVVHTHIQFKLNAYNIRTHITYNPLLLPEENYWASVICLSSLPGKCNGYKLSTPIPPSNRCTIMQDAVWNAFHLRFSSILINLLMIRLIPHISPFPKHAIPHGGKMQVTILTDPVCTGKLIVGVCFNAWMRIWQHNK